MARAVPDAARTLRVSERVRAHRPKLSSAMTKLADVLLEDPEAPLELSVLELAARAGSSPATVTRFCRQLGYEGYRHLRVAVAADTGRPDDVESQGWRDDAERSLSPEDSPAEVMSLLLNSQVRSLRATADVLDPEVAATVARRLVAADQVDIFGIGGSFVMAAEMQVRLYSVGVNARSWGEVHAGLVSASMQSSRGVAIGISHSGRTRETIDMLGRAREAGAFTVAITSREDSPLGQQADLCLLAAVPEQYLHPANISAQHNQLFVLDVLYLLVTQLDIPGSASRIEAGAASVAGRRLPDHSSTTRTERNTP